MNASLNARSLLFTQEEQALSAQERQKLMEDIRAKEMQVQNVRIDVEKKNIEVRSAVSHHSKATTTSFQLKVERLHKEMEAQKSSSAISSAAVMMEHVQMDNAYNDTNGYTPREPEVPNYVSISLRLKRIKNILYRSTKSRSTPAPTVTR